MIVFAPPVAQSWAPVKVVLMSGLSDPACCALSAVQRGFLDQLRSPDVHVVDANFPYLMPTRVEQPAIPILVASWHNGTQFFGAGRARYREHAAGHWRALASSCEALLVITLSCGLQILNTCLASGVTPTRIEVLALGPVAWQRPPVSHLLVRGSRDYVCNPWFRAVDVRLSGVGHMDYLRHPEVLDLARTRLARLVD